MNRLILYTILTNLLFFFSWTTKAYYKKMEKNQIKISNGTTEFGSIAYERVFNNLLKGQQSIWASYIFPWKESHEISTLKVNGYSAGLRHYFSQRKGMTGFFIGGGYFNQKLTYTDSSGVNSLSGRTSSVTLATGGAFAIKRMRLEIELYSLLNSRVEFKGSPYGSITRADIADKIGKTLDYEVSREGELEIPFGFKISLGFTF